MKSRQWRDDELKLSMFLMSNNTKSSVDLNLWRKRDNAPEHERWKWYRDTWDPVINKVYTGEKNIKDLGCPVCGQKELYAYFEVFHIAKRASTEEKQPVYVANRYFGCHSCKTQIRDFGEVPRWVKGEDINWVSKEAREDAVSDLAQINLKLPNDDDHDST